MATRAHRPWGFPKAPRMPVCRRSAPAHESILLMRSTWKGCTLHSKDRLCVSDEGWGRYVIHEMHICCQSDVVCESLCRGVLPMSGSAEACCCTGGAAAAAGSTTIGQSAGPDTKDEERGSQPGTRPPRP